MKNFALPLLATIFAAAPTMRADEGMWTFDNLPLKLLKEKYNFTPSQEWIDHVRLSAISMGGCSASFVSADGLMLTNHHCGRGQVAAISTADNDFLKNGYVARTRAEELKVRMSLRVLKQMQNVTARINGAVKPNMDAKAAEEAKSQAHQAAVEEMRNSTGLNCTPVRLYQGGEFWVYGYETFEDVRLVAAPELQVAAFGGDYDNFTYPRHDLDFTLFRVYKDDKPYNPTNFLKWSVEGLKDGELTFVVGHPGTTRRGWTYSQMLNDRDIAMPVSIKNYERSRSTLLEYGRKNPENMRAIQTQLLGIENSLKASKGYYVGLLDVDGMKQVKAKEDALRAKVNQDPKLKALAGQSWEAIDKALNSTKANAATASLAGAAPTGLISQLRLLVLRIENPPQQTQNAGGGGRGGTQAGGGRVPAAQSATPELDLMQMEAWLKDVQAMLPAQSQLAMAALNGMTPAAAAKSILASPLSQEPAKNALIEGGKKALEASKDHALVLAKTIVAIVNESQKLQADANAIIADQISRISRARLEAYGKDVYPDATSTLRLSYGPVSTFAANGTIMQPFTTFGGLYDRHIGWGGNAANVHDGSWHLPERWIDKRSMINPDVKLNFSHSVDIIGGNSGSPVINRNGELVGVIFDGNITMLPGRYYYKESDNRGVSVDARAIIETLEKVMDAGHIVKELTGK